LSRFSKPILSAITNEINIKEIIKGMNRRRQSYKVGLEGSGMKLAYQFML
jgi:hypothetical protein